MNIKKRRMLNYLKRNKNVNMCWGAYYRKQQHIPCSKRIGCKYYEKAKIERGGDNPIFSSDQKVTLFPNIDYFRNCKRFLDK
jgi:hypothetical protein